LHSSNTYGLRRNLVARTILGALEYEEIEEGSDRQDAEQFLRDFQADVPAPTRQVKAEADCGSYSYATIRRVQKTVGITAVKGYMKKVGYGSCKPLAP
jgi:putative DNA primase/helicase